MACPNEENALEIQSFFDEHLEVIQNHSLDFEYATEQASGEWLVRILPFIHGYDYPNDLIPSNLVSEVRQSIYQILKQHPQWNYYYAWFELDIYDEAFSHGELLSDLLEVLIHKKQSKRKHQEHYRGIVLQNKLAKSMGISQVFEPFNANYCWFPFEGF